MKAGQFLLPFTLLFILSCDQPRTQKIVTTGESIDAIKTATGREVAALNNGSAEEMVAVLTDDAVFMPPNQPAIAGKESIREWLREFFDQYTVSASHRSGDVMVSGDLGIEPWTVDLRMTPKAGGDPVVDSLKGVHIYHRQADGSWKIARDIWNSTRPIMQQ